MSGLNISSKYLLIVALAAVLAVAGLGAVFADSHNGNTYTGCLNNGGQIKNVAVGGSPLNPCGPSEIQISWNETGPQGEQGPQGPEGPQGPAGGAGQNCTQGQFVTGFDALGNIVCGSPVTPGPVCGNGIVESGEVCDDGNLVNGDGCSESCQLEDLCADVDCDDGDPCTDDTCQAGGCIHVVNPAICPVDMDGDGYSPPLDCDDSNANVNPGSPEICGDYMDNDCDMQVDEAQCIIP